MSFCLFVVIDAYEEKVGGVFSYLIVLKRNIIIGIKYSFNLHASLSHNRVMSFCHEAIRIGFTATLHYFLP